MTDVNELRARARQQSSERKLSGAAVLCAAVILPLAGVSAGLLARGGETAPAPAEEMAASLDDPVAQEGTSGDVAAAIAQQYPGAVKLAQKALADVDEDTISAAVQQRLYRDVTGLLMACRKEFPANTTYESLLKSYQQRNAPALTKVQAALMAEAGEQTAELDKLRNKLKDGNKTQQMLEVAKFHASGGAMRYGANMTVAMSGLAETNHKADSEKCRVLAEELSTGKHNIEVPA